jgi:uncharacterized protein (TIGR02594 family)
MISKIAAFFKSLFKKPVNQTSSEVVKEIKQEAKKLPWMIKAMGELNQKEVTGSKHNPRIIEYHKSTSLQAGADEVPWCSSFVNWCFQECGLFRTHSAGAASWLMWGIMLDKPVYGCVVIKRRTGGNHVTFFIRYEMRGSIAGFIGLGGNQNNRVGYDWYPLDTVRGYRWPQDYPKPSA